MGGGGEHAGLTGVPGAGWPGPCPGPGSAAGGGAPRRAAGGGGGARARRARRAPVSCAPGTASAPPPTRPAANELYQWAPRVVEAMRRLPELRDVGSDQQDHGLRMAVDIDRPTASRLGITPQSIDDALYNSFGQRQVATIFTQLNQYRVVL